MKRIIAVICSVVVMAASMPVMAATQETTEFNGDIIKNPWAELFTDAPTEPETESETQPETEPDTTKNDIQEFDPASLTYTSLECAGTEGLSIDYCIQSSTIEGATPWYGDGGVTFQIAYSDPNGEGGNGDVQVNGAAPAEGVVTMMGTGIFKINPTLLADNAYSVITLKLATAGEMTLVIKKGTPAETPTDPQPTDPQPTDPQPTDPQPTDPQPTEPDSSEVPTPVPTDVPTAVPTEKPTVVPTAAPTQKETTAKKITVAKTKVKTASKKKTSNKVKISLKKVKNAKKYQVQISKTKKFKKVLVKKVVKKVKFTLKSKKLKNKKKLYVRARAVRVVGKKVYRGKWSKVKKIKIKK